MFSQKYCPRSALAHYILNFLPKIIKNCTLISHFASASGELPPDHLQRFAPGTHWGKKDPLAAPFQKNPASTPVNPLQRKIM